MKSSVEKRWHRGGSGSGMPGSRESTRRLRRGFALAATSILAAGTFAGAGSVTAPLAAADPAEEPAGAVTIEQGQPEQCAVPTDGAGYASANPADVGIDQAKLDDAIVFAASRLRINVQVFRNNCLIGRGPLNDTTDNLKWNLWSSTKSVIAMLAGIANTQGKLDVNAPIGTHLEPGEGDEAHRAITVRDLLTQTSGLQQSIVSEGFPSGLDLDPSAPKQALGLPLIHEPGTFFESTQRGPDLLAHVVERAVGEDLQQYAQRELFDPIGVGADSYHWSRDRSGNTYGFAFLYMAPLSYSRLGMLLANNGDWAGRQIISADYMKQLRTPTETNRCYGFLVWVNDKPCTAPTIPSRKTYAVSPFEGLPDDAFAMVGALQQNNFMIPSLGLQATWNGVLGDVSPDPSTVLSANSNSELARTFLRKLVAAYSNPTVPDPGAYEPTFNLDVDINNLANPAVLGQPFGLGPFAVDGCNEFSCGEEPLRAPLSDTGGCFVLACIPAPGEVPAPQGS